MQGRIPAGAEKSEYTYKKLSYVAVQGVCSELVSEFAVYREKYRELFDILRRFRAVDDYLALRNRELRVGLSFEP
jgi:hypothetical protein